MPEPVDAAGELSDVLASPPRASPGRCVVGKRRPTRPHHAVKLAAVRKSAEHSLSLSLRVEGKVGIRLDAGVDDCNELRAAGVQLVGERLQVGERRLIRGERAEAAHVVDVEVEDAEGQVSLTESLDDAPCLGECLEAPAGMLVAEGPARGERGTPGELGEASQDGSGRAGNHVRPAGPAGKSRRNIRVESDRPVECRVVEYQVAACVSRHEIHRHCDVDRILAGAVGAVGILVPEAIGDAGLRAAVADRPTVAVPVTRAPIQGRRPQPQTVDCIVGPDCGRLAPPRPDARRRVLFPEEPARGEMAEMTRDGNAQFERRALHAPLFSIAGDCGACTRPGLPRHGVGGEHLRAVPAEEEKVRSEEPRRKLGGGEPHPRPIRCRLHGDNCARGPGRLICGRSREAGIRGVTLREYATARIMVGKLMSRRLLIRSPRDFMRMPS